MDKTKWELVDPKTLTSFTFVEGHTPQCIEHKQGRYKAGYGLFDVNCICGKDPWVCTPPQPEDQKGAEMSGKVYCSECRYYKPWAGFKEIPPKPPSIIKKLWNKIFG